MENIEREKILNRITQLIGKALDVKATHRPNPPNVISSVTLNKGAFSEWKNSVESFILKVAGEKSHFYKNFEKGVKYESKSHVDAGVGILMALRESLIQGDLSTPNYSFTEQKTSSPGIIAAAGGGGGGGGGPGGGRGGGGGSVTIGIPPEQIGIQHVKNLHRQYWGMFLKSTWAWIKSHISEVIIGLIIAALATWFGFNR